MFYGKTMLRTYVFHLEGHTNLYAIRLGQFGDTVRWTVIEMIFNLMSFIFLA